MSVIIDIATQLRSLSRPRKLVKLVAGLTALKLLLIPLIACDPFGTGFEEVEDAQLYEARVKTEAVTPQDKLVVMNWNVKFGGARIDFWFDCHGDRVLMTKEEVINNMEAMAKKIRQVDPDILLIQEVDVDSKRAAFVDQMQWLLDNTSLNYGAYASQWKARYIPSDGIGRMDSGSGILSRWKITDGKRLALPAMTDQDAITQYFYLKRNILTTVVDVPGIGPLYVLNIHTDAYSQDGTKKKQIDIFKEKLDEIHAAGQIFIAGGDLNTLPPGSEQRYDFVDSVCEDEDFMADDFRQEADWLLPFYNDYQPAISLADYQADNTPYFTHSTTGDIFWNRKLDYIFTNGAFVQGSGMVHQDVNSGGMETMPLSDHAPVTVEFLLEQ